MSPRYININGKILKQDEAAIPVEDRSFRYGFGLFETMLCTAGQIRFAELHWARLQRGLDALGFQMPVRFMQTLQAETKRLIARHEPAAAMRIRLQVSAGSGGYFDAGDWRPFFSIECWSLDTWTQELNENGLVLGIATARKEPGPYSQHKTTSALCYALAAREAKAEGWNDALLTNAAGNIVESSIANVFALYQGRVITPPLSDGCIDGIMRQVLLDRFKAAGTPVYEESISPKMIPHVEGVFLSNAVRGIRWVKNLENEELSPHFALQALALPK